ncbi:hypothetical protein D3C87_228090 [compost metagenome]
MRFYPGGACVMTAFKDFVVTPGRSYNVDFDLDRSGIANFTVEIYTAATLSGTGTLITTLSASNGRLSYTFTPAAGQNFIRVSFKKNSGENTSFYIDNLQIRTVAAPYAAVVVMKSDYYPFGMQMPDRHSNDDKYRYGYNGMEKDKEMHGEGNSYTTEFRQYDPRLGRWLSLDPLAASAPEWSPYRTFFDNPIMFSDPSGLFEGRGDAKKYKRENKIKGRVRKSDEGGYEISSKKDRTIYSKGDDSGSYSENHKNDGVEESAMITKPSNSGFWSKVWNVVVKIDNIYREYGSLIPGVGSAPQAMETIEKGKVLITGKDFDGNKSNRAVAGGFLILDFLPAAGKYSKAFQVLERSSKLSAASKEVGILDKILGSVCFTKDTKISTDEGFKDIENIQVGDTVWSFDETTGNKSLKVVYNTVVRQADHLLQLKIGTDTLQTTDDHPFYVNGNWVKAMDLNVGDSLDLLNGGKIVLSEKTRIDTAITIYNFAVSDYATYYVGEHQILVHNNNPCIEVAENAGEQVVKKTADEIAKNCKKMSESQITQLLGEGWHKNGAKTKIVKKFGRDLKGSTNADFFIEKNTGEILLQGNQSKAWVQTGLFLE